MDKVSYYLQEHLQIQQGLLGFCQTAVLPDHKIYGVANQARFAGPSILADADDTAKAILTLHLLGRTTRLGAMIEHFRSKQGQFQTYLGERDVSFSANCNILKAMLADPRLPKYNRICRASCPTCATLGGREQSKTSGLVTAFILFGGLNPKQLYRTYLTIIP